MTNVVNTYYLIDILECLIGATERLLLVDNIREHVII